MPQHPGKADTMAALDMALADASGPAEPGAVEDELEPGGNVECQVCGTLIDALTGVPADPSQAAPPLPEKPPAPGGGASLPI